MNPALAPRKRLVSRAVRLRATQPIVIASVTLVALTVIVAIFAPLLAPFPKDAGTATHPDQILQAPSTLHWLGTDEVGRDVLSRVIFGARISPFIAVTVVLIAAVVGVILGLIAGYVGGIVDDIIMRITDIFLAVPALLLALALTIILPSGVGSTILAISVTWWPWYARLVRGEVVAISRRRYIDSAKILGLSRKRIAFRHILPNAVTPVLVQASLDFGGVILVAAGLSFLGLGAQEPTPDWGLMVNNGQSLFSTHWWLVTFPGLAILLTSMAFNLLGDAAHEWLDPHQRRAT